MNEIPVCQLPAMPPDPGAAECRWPTKSITWGISGSMPGFTAQRLREIYAQAWKVWTDVADFSATYSDSNPMVTMGHGNIDGPSNVLAWSEMPCGASIRSVTQKYDSSERWSQDMPGPGEIDLVTVAAHEIGHAVGIPHIESGNILYAGYVGPRRSPGPGDLREIISRYGRRTGEPPPPPPPPPGQYPDWFRSWQKELAAWLNTKGAIMKTPQVSPQDFWRAILLLVVELLKWVVERPKRGEILLRLIEDDQFPCEESRR